MQSSNHNWFSRDGVPLARKPAAGGVASLLGIPPRQVRRIVDDGEPLGELRQVGGDFCLVFDVSYSRPPRSALCTKASLEAALPTAIYGPGSTDEQAWRKVCQQHGVGWPERKAAA